jgi:hypothetical protein
MPYIQDIKMKELPPQRRGKSMWRGMNGLGGIRKKKGLTAAEMGIE